MIVSGCPNGHVVVNGDTNKDVLTDNCNEEDGNKWLSEEGAIDADAEVIIDMGCVKTVRGLQMKNIKRNQGGTKIFTIYVSESIEGPWKEIFTDKFPEQTTDGCGQMKTSDLRLAEA